MPDAMRERLFAPLDRRLADMDAAGIEQQVLSVPISMPEDLPSDELRSIAAAANSELHTLVDGNPDRFAAFAALPWDAPDDAAAELERTVTQLGFVGTMIFGTVGGKFLDDPMFSPILETAARLDVAIYLHPGTPPRAVRDAYYSGFNPEIERTLAQAGYGWHYETSLHATRMVVAGVFDRLPGLKIILGHLGEGIPFHLSRIDETLRPFTPNLARPIRDYFRENFWVTTSGYFYDGPFQLTREAFGDDRVMFSVDYPFADNRRGREWFDRLALESELREKIGHGTADRLLKLRSAQLEA
jgi:predicted TIM-barrel fold metal-dependent hydrolase